MLQHNFAKARGTFENHGTAPGHGFAIAGVPVRADPSGALYIEDANLLVVSDLHLEQGSSFAARGQLLPPYDTALTLAQLNRVIMTYQPKTVIALGDSFHDGKAGERLAPEDFSKLDALMAGRDWIWIAGNHDPDIPARLGETVEEVETAGLVFRHQPSLRKGRREIAGHLHPAARVVSPSGSVRRKCFVSDGQRCIMPAFGAYTGGLNFRSPAFAGLFSTRAITAHVIHRGKIYAVSESRCAA